ncbi:MAG: ABC transporter substrate-binding protein [Tsuneonella suprasediminis]|nr:ABC transporter substrate-binding protein [Altererythrobacter sp. N1]
MMTTSRLRLSAMLAAAALLGGCGGSGDPDTVEVAFIADSADLLETGLRLSSAAQQVRAATATGLVSLDSHGEIVPSIAERWIVTEDGLSYIFRVRDANWPDGSQITAEQVRDSLRQTIRQLRGTSLGLDLAAVSQVRAMTGRVVEIDLSAPVPDFLQLLAQPELGISYKKQVAGPMVLAENKRDGGIVLTPLPPEKRGLPAVPDWEESVRKLHVRGLSGADAVAAFGSGEVDVVLDGRLADFPRADTGPLSRGTVRLDAAQGIFGLRVVRDDGLLGDAVRREALAMAIDRDTLMSPFNIAGWVPSTRLVPATIAGGDAGERWAGLSLEERQASARQRIAGWANGGDNKAEVRISLPTGPGSDRLFQQIAQNWQSIGVTAVRVGPGSAADLVLIDTLARFGSPRWYLNQFACSVRRLLCSPEADELVKLATQEIDPAKRHVALLEAETRLTAMQGFIPLGAPVRWSLVRGSVLGFAPTRLSVHPLFPLAVDPK